MGSEGKSRKRRSSPVSSQDDEDERSKKHRKREDRKSRRDDEKKERKKKSEKSHKHSKSGDEKDFLFAVSIQGIGCTLDTSGFELHYMLTWLEGQPILAFYALDGMSCELVEDLRELR
ncbi:uncharacterized protein A4U43_C08F25620 [Asparagus officinalis]|nr:uncharacterized protein A4U43_C08F25620 [Asparagus officinalis]